MQWSVCFFRCRAYPSGHKRRGTKPMASPWRVSQRCHAPEKTCNPLHSAPTHKVNPDCMHTILININVSLAYSGQLRFLGLNIRSPICIGRELKIRLKPGCIETLAICFFINSLSRSKRHFRNLIPVKKTVSLRENR